VGTVFKKTFTKALPAGAELFARDIADKLAAYFGLYLVKRRKG
jgi:hypothetical protein